MKAAEWKDTDEGPALHVYCHVSGGFVFGSAHYDIKSFTMNCPQFLKPYAVATVLFFAAHTQLDNAPIWVHFESTGRQYNVTERWGVLADSRQR